ncbi:hypothetical protein C8Q74DRAFT_1247589 [Fomes fomentarius]|nr:hypothetical protein C8Q74DRAFT_1247589 [Fomes fomentarius]
MRSLRPLVFSHYRMTSRASFHMRSSRRILLACADLRFPVRPDIHTLASEDDPQVWHVYAQWHTCPTPEAGQIIRGFICLVLLLHSALAKPLDRTFLTGTFSSLRFLFAVRTFVWIKSTLVPNTHTHCVAHLLSSGLNQNYHRDHLTSMNTDCFE